MTPGAEPARRGVAAAIRRIHHVGIVVRRLDEAYGFYRDTLRLPLVREAVVVDQGVRAALLSAGESEVELLEPIAPGGVERFLAKRGEGLHHVCFEVSDVDAAITEFRARQIELIDHAPRTGLAGRVAFLHPRACAGVLVELATPPPDGPAPAGWLRLKRLVLGVDDPRRTAALFERLFGLPEVAMNDGPRMMLAAGRGSLLMVPAGEVGGAAGMVALSLVATDFPTLTERLAQAGVRLLKGTGEVTVDPSSSHGVHLHISRYE
jgi:methylmalonyl-CoA/ethylmalonyl-CoA epimerase